MGGPFLPGQFLNTHHEFPSSGRVSDKIFEREMLLTVLSFSLNFSERWAGKVVIPACCREKLLKLSNINQMEIEVLH